MNATADILSQPHADNQLGVFVSDRGDQSKVDDIHFSWLTPSEVARQPALMATWETLASASTSLYAMYQSPIWWEHLLATSRDENLRLAVLRDQHDSVRGIAPFEKVEYPGRKGWLSRLWGVVRENVWALAGSEPLLPDAAPWYRALLDGVAARISSSDPVFCKSLPMSGGFRRFLDETQEATKTRCFVHRESRVRPFHSAQLEGSFAQYMTKFSAKTRQTWFRKERNLRNHCGGDLQVIRVEQEEQVDMLADAMQLVNEQSWKTARCNPLLWRREQATNKFKDAARRGLLRCYVLRTQDRPLAYVIGYQIRDLFHYSDTGYDLDYSRYSPGNVLLMRLIDDLFQHRPASRLNFGIGDADYKRHFGNQVGEDVGVLLLPRTLGNGVRVSINRSLVGMRRWGATGVSAVCSILSTSTGNEQHGCGVD